MNNLINVNVCNYQLYNVVNYINDQFLQVYYLMDFKICTWRIWILWRQKYFNAENPTTNLTALSEARTNWVMGATVI